MKPIAILAGASLAALAGCAELPPPASQAAPAPATRVSADAALEALADRMVAQQVAYDPPDAYWLGVDAPDHRRWPDRSQAALASFQQARDALLQELLAIEPAHLSSRNRSVHAAMVEKLEAQRQTRICRFDLWAVKHMGGWHNGLAGVAKEQPVSTAEERAQALERWAALPGLVDQEIANARLGLERGYSAPKPVVRRVIRQIERIVSAAPETLPFYSPAKRSQDSAFQAAFRDVLAGPVNAAFRRYLAFLNDEYLPRAREALGVAANPDGRECYAASLRSYTTLPRPPEDVFELGQRTVNANLQRVRELGLAAFGTDDIPAVVARIAEAPNNRFSSEEELIEFSREVVGRAKEKSRPLFVSMPEQEMRVEPFHAYMRGSGVTSHYEPQPDPNLPAFYRINSEAWTKETRGKAELVAVHEGYPGHHMQAISANATGGHPVLKLTGNSAYLEGWGRYSEALAEEAQIYETIYAPMTRRLWPARGMVVDPGLHLMGWTREQVVEFIAASGVFSRPEADDLVDRIAMMPGQLTAYDTGALEIMALRRQAEAALGEQFDIRRFHEVVLGSGTVPLVALRANVEAWIAAERAARLSSTNAA